MKSIWKYTLKAQEHQEIIMPLGVKVLSVQEQHEEIVVYALVDVGISEIEIVNFVTYNTGHEISNTSLINYEFLDTVKMNNGHLMFHVFYKKSNF